MGWGGGRRQCDLLGTQRTSVSVSKCCAVTHSWLCNEFMIAHLHCCLRGLTSSLDYVYILVLESQRYHSEQSRLSLSRARTMGA